MGHYARILTDDELAKLSSDKSAFNDFQKRKLESELQKNWDKFYLRNKTSFFKDRHWTREEFPKILPEACEKGKKLLECGCGVGNLIFPLLEYFPHLFIYACDFSLRAVNYVKSNERFDERKCFPFVCDLTKDSLKNLINETDVDVCTMIFLLSAIHPANIPAVLRNVFKVLKAGAVVFVRDYGLFDHAQLRFGRGKKMEENLYVRQDGTFAYFFSEDALRKLFVDNGYEELSVSYISNKTINRKKNMEVPRIFIQAGQTNNAKRTQRSIITSTNSSLHGRHLTPNYVKIKIMIQQHLSSRIFVLVVVVVLALICTTNGQLATYLDRAKQAENCMIWSSWVVAALSEKCLLFQVEHEKPCGMCSYKQSCGYKCHRRKGDNRYVNRIFVAESLCDERDFNGESQQQACHTAYDALPKENDECQVWPNRAISMPNVTGDYRNIVNDFQMSNCIKTLDDNGKIICRCCCHPYHPHPKTFQCQA
ncbi:tRNA N(3)-methylcytidine methyltransferase METTL6 [Trichinella spiralis]|uniref:tRNA N(3)-methylcytidine methyltransferase METTL6 n=1 Tax=Trichinella spiralis TaxID=6334 RepID=A0ABR3KKV2_TRISP